MFAIPQGPQEPSDILVDDFVQARRFSEGEPFESAEGMCTLSSDTAVTLGSRKFTSASGWTFEVIRRALPFPATLSEIDATLISTGETVRLMGKGAIWTTLDGANVPTTDINAFSIAE